MNVVPMKESYIPSPSDPHVAICIPCMDKPHIHFSQSLATMLYQCGKMGTPLALIHQGGSLITRARNQCIEQIENFEKQGTRFDYIFFLDSDMVFPAYTLHALMQHQKDIIGCTYVRRSAPFDVHGKTLENRPISTEGQTLIEMSGMPTGCLLIKREVFHKLKRPFFRMAVREETPERPAVEFGEDYVFCAMAREQGFSIWLEVELSKKVGHIAERVLYPEEDSWPEHREVLKKKIKEAQSG